MADDSETDMSEVEVDDADDSDYEVHDNRTTLKAKKLKRSHGKWKLYYENRVFKKEWVEIFPWCEEDPEDPRFAICRACNKKIKAHKGILESHQKTKTHLKNLSGSDDIDDDDEPKKSDKNDPKNVSFSIPLNGQPSQPGMEHILSDDQFSFFTESPIDAQHQAITNLIDKLVERYHDKRVENLKVQNETVLQLSAERAELKRTQKRREVEMRMERETHRREVEEVKLKLMQQQHESRINAMEIERDAKLRAVEQELMFARQEYEKKMKLLDVQLSCMK